MKAHYTITWKYGSERLHWWNIAMSVVLLLAMKELPRDTKWYYCFDHFLLPGPFLLSYSLIVFSFSSFFRFFVMRWIKLAISSAFECTYHIVAYHIVISSAFLGWLFDRVDLIKPVSSVRAYVRPPVHKKSFFDFSEIWQVGRGRRVLHAVMQYDPIQGQGQGHEPFKVGNPAVLKSYLLCHLQWELATDHWFLN